ncbi:hypothetical protein U8335_01380 [Roseiconus lacunae]|uniref:hypothetical protein n=1 Tax=Roseiconus lacunae TaxID=2605694 RepID=UPI003092C8CE|nr:hypothetical protein U8335_01380 [Stieleria sp. HD01]
MAQWLHPFTAVGDAFVHVATVDESSAERIEFNEPPSTGRQSLPKVIEMKMQLRTILCCALAVFATAGCDVDQTKEGELPDVDVEVTGDPGQLPEYDVEGPDVDVSTETKEVEVPDVDVDMKKTDIEVPNVDVDLPDDNE